MSSKAKNTKPTTGRDVGKRHINMSIPLGRVYLTISDYSSPASVELTFDEGEKIEEAIDIIKSAGGEDLIDLIASEGINGFPVTNMDEDGATMLCKWVLDNLYMATAKREKLALRYGIKLEN